MTFFSCLTVNDTLDDILADSGDEEEEDAVVSKVLDEIGIEISGKVTFFNSLCTVLTLNSNKQSLVI